MRTSKAAGLFVVILSFSIAILPCRSASALPWRLQLSKSKPPRKRFNEGAPRAGFQQSAVKSMQPEDGTKKSPRKLSPVARKVVDGLIATSAVAGLWAAVGVATSLPFTLFLGGGLHDVGPMLSSPYYWGAYAFTTMSPLLMMGLAPVVAETANLARPGGPRSSLLE